MIIILLSELSKRKSKSIHNASFSPSWMVAPRRELANILNHSISKPQTYLWITKWTRLEVVLSLQALMPLGNHLSTLMHRLWTMRRESKPSLTPIHGLNKWMKKSFNLRPSPTPQQRREWAVLQTQSLVVKMLHLCALMLSSRFFYYVLGLWHYIMWHVMWLLCHMPLFFFFFLNQQFITWLAVEDRGSYFRNYIQRKHTDMN